MKQLLIQYKVERKKDLMDKYQPMFFVHGHVHTNYGARIPRTIQRGETTIVNAYERYLIEI